MSSYIDHHACSDRGFKPGAVTHSWADFTRLRLMWLYDDPLRAASIDAGTISDKAAWRNLGRRSAA
jgi:hypothetical protein